MCLSTVLRGKDKREVLAKLKDEITVWKCLIKYGPRDYSTDCKNLPVHAGTFAFKQNLITRSNQSTYRGGGHFFLSELDAENWNKGGSLRDVTVRCKIKKEWINTIGEQRGFPVVVVKKAIFPKYIGPKVASA